MAASLTNYGQEVALFDDQNRPSGTPNTLGGLAQQGKKLKLFKNTSTPARDGTGFVEVANGNGYTTGGQALTPASFTLSIDSGNAQIMIDDKTWTASGGSIADIDGVYLTDSDDNVLAWWERASSITLADGDSIVAENIYVRDMERK